MANHWNSPHAIWRDLSVAQGRAVPAQIEHTVALDERPPRLAVREETEQQFYIDYVGGGEGGEYNSSGPNIALIKKMLQEIGPSEEECPEMNTPETCIIITKKPVKQKNLAIASLIEMHDNPRSQDLQNGLFTAQPSSSHAASPIFPPVEMFKRKKKKNSENRTSDDSPTSVKSEPDPARPRVFVPSARAAEFYNKYAQHARAEQRAQETVWTRAQRQMMEIDKRKMNALSPGGDSTSSDASAHGMDLVRLSTPRHTFTDAEDCVVCQVMTKKMDTQVKTEPK